MIHTLTLNEIQTPSTTFWLMITHHYTKPEGKRFKSSEYIIWTQCMRDSAPYYC